MRSDRDPRRYAMRALVPILTSALLLAACGGAAAPSASPAASNTLTFTADLKAENEVPPVSNEEKGCSGKATITFTLTRDASGKIASGTATADVTATGLPTTAAITLAHIHGPNGQSGKVATPIIGFKTDAANALPVTSSGFSVKWANIKADGDAIQKIVDDPSQFYFNIHSKTNGGGVCRGQLVKM
jgi:CHRD domain-containing protein